MSPDELARIAYAAYGATTDFKNFRGEQMPSWIDLPVQIQQAWMAAANAAAMAAVACTTSPPPRTVSATSVKECKLCGFLWPPGIENRRCPGCQQMYEG